MNSSISDKTFGVDTSSFANMDFQKARPKLVFGKLTSKQKNGKIEENKQFEQKQTENNTNNAQQQNMNASQNTQNMNVEKTNLSANAAVPVKKMMI